MVGQGQVVGLPAAQELGGEDLAEEGPRVPHDAHLDVPFLEQLVPHAAAVDASPARRGPHLGPVGRLAQQGLALLQRAGVAAAPAAARAIHAAPPRARRAGGDNG